MVEVSKPRLLDLFCGAGGCARGYQDAGFYVVGVDLDPQPRYAGGEFVQAGALDYLGAHWREFDAIHASPPCQHYANVTKWRGEQSDHPDLIGPTRALLEFTGLPWVIENVLTPEVRGDIVLCGTMFGLRVRRHRLFETNWSGVVMTPPCQHRADDYAFEHKQERAYADALGCEWMTNREGRQAIPPAYTEFIGQRLMQYVCAEAAA
ncbi:MAG TPA: DNA cytosine methyltransferase [Candidatus Dormibacteraeota bacterium]